MKMVQKLIWSLSLCLALIFSIPVLIFLWLLLGGWVFPTLLFITLATLTLVSYYKDISIPGIRKILKREYIRVKFSLTNKPNRTKLNKLYLRFLYYLILLFKSSEHSYLVIKEELLHRFSKKINKTNHSKLDKVKKTIHKLKQGKQVNEQDTLELENYLFQFNKHKQKTATFTSVTALVALIMVSMVSSLIPHLPSFLNQSGYL